MSEKHMLSPLSDHRPTELRHVQVRRDGRWQDCRLWDVKKGEIFCMFEDGHPVEAHGQVTFVAAGDGYRSTIGGKPDLTSQIGGIVVEDTFKVVEHNFHEAEEDW
jgi:hypothetical protein